MADTVYRRIEEELRRRKDARQLPGSWADLAREIGVKRAAVTNWKDRGVPPGQFVPVADCFGWSVDQLLGTAPIPRKGVAHDPSLAKVTVSPERIKLSWGELMSGELPEHFTLEVQDDAMAPLLSKGDAAHFKRTTEPRPGRPVLLVDAAGHGYIRIYEARGAGRFRGVAMSPGYQALDSQEDQLRVVAELEGWG